MKLVKAMQDIDKILGSRYTSYYRWDSRQDRYADSHAVGPTNSHQLVLYVLDREKEDSKEVSLSLIVNSDTMLERDLGGMVRTVNQWVVKRNIKES